MSANLKKFNSVLEALIKTIIRLCPEETNIKVGYEYFKICPSKKIWELFVQNVYPLRLLIQARDEDFFLNSEVNKEALEENVSADVGGEGAFNSILNIKDAWVNRLSNVEKEKIWKALGVLIILCEKVMMEEMAKSQG